MWFPGDTSRVSSPFVSITCHPYENVVPGNLHRQLLGSLVTVARRPGQWGSTSHAELYASELSPLYWFAVVWLSFQILLQKYVGKEESFEIKTFYLLNVFFLNGSL